MTNLPASVDLGRLASIEVAVSLFLEQILLVPLSPEDRAQLCQTAEERFVQLHHSIMDKFVICCAQKESVMYYQSRNNSSECLPFNAASVSVIVCDPGVKTSTIPSCSEVIRVLQTGYPEIHTLHGVRICQINAMKDILGEALYNLAMHVVSEDELAIKSKDALLHDDYESFGGLMLYSHTSFRDILNVSCNEIDTLVELAAEEESVYGIKMDEEGTVLILVERSQEDKVMKRMKKGYQKLFGKECEMTICYASEGAKIIPSEKIEAGTLSKWKRPWLWACVATAVGVGVMMFMRSHHH